MSLLLKNKIGVSYNYSTLHLGDKLMVEVIYMN